MAIHPTAVIDPKSKVHPSCKIGPYCVIAADVEIGEGCQLDAHVSVDGPTKIGAHNRIFPFAAVGGAPQDISYAGEPTRLEIGDHNVIREFVTINRGTMKGGGCTRIGDYNLIMAYTHIAHDCQIGSHIIMANAATLGGHVSVGDWANCRGALSSTPFCADWSALHLLAGEARSPAMCCRFRRLLPNAGRKPTG